MFRQQSSIREKQKTFHVVIRKLSQSYKRIFQVPAIKLPQVFRQILSCPPVALFRPMIQLIKVGIRRPNC